jgi:hypothetical protein
VENLFGIYGAIFQVYFIGECDSFINRVFNILSNMITKGFGLILVVSFLTITAVGQGIEVGVQSGVGTFRMNDLKEINKIIIQSSPFSVKQTSDFPPYFIYEVNISGWINELFAGFSMGFQSTGSRISGKDYTADYRYDILISSFNPALSFGYRYINNDSYYGIAALNFGLLNSRVNFRQYFRLFDSIQTESMKVNAENYFLQPELRVGYKMKYFNLEAYGAYLLQFGKSGLHDPSDPEMMLYSEDGNPIKAGWSGLRIGIAIKIPLFKKLIKFNLDNKHINVPYRIFPRVNI